MATPTPRLGLEKIDASQNPVEYRETINGNAEKLDGVALERVGARADRTASTKVDGTVWRETETGDVYWTDGSAWKFLRSDALGIYGSGAASSAGSAKGVIGSGKTYNHPLFSLSNSVNFGPMTDVQVAQAGRYEIKAHVLRNDPFTVTLRTVDNPFSATPAAVYLDSVTSPGGSTKPVALVGALNIDAGWFVEILLQSGGGSSTFVVQDFHIRRVGP